MSPGSCPRGGTLGRWGAQGGQISLNLDYHVNSKIFIQFFVCVITNKIL